ncbi:MAG: hypothetical protein ACKPKO_63725, partial [Candidatus Fonsibacter sp.]
RLAEGADVGFARSFQRTFRNMSTERKRLHERYMRRQLLRTEDWKHVCECWNMLVLRIGNV